MMFLLQIVMVIRVSDFKVEDQTGMVELRCAEMANGTLCAPRSSTPWMLPLSAENWGSLIKVIGFVIITTGQTLQFNIFFFTLLQWMYIGAKPVNSGFSRGYSTQTVWLMDTLCNGTEESILDCPTQGFGGYQRQLCTHNSDVGVTCRAPEMGELRILGGMNTSAGRLEVFNHKEWGTICDDYWSARDAEVACRQLGFSTYGI